MSRLAESSANRKELLTVAETCLKLRMTRQTVMKHIQDGNLTAHKIGRKVLITTKSIDELLDDSQLKPVI